MFVYVPLLSFNKIEMRLDRDKLKNIHFFLSFHSPFTIFARAKVKCARLWRCFGVEKNKIIHPHGRLLHGKL